MTGARPTRRHHHRVHLHRCQRPGNRRTSATPPTAAVAPPEPRARPYFRRLTLGEPLRPSGSASAGPTCGHPVTPCDANPALGRWAAPFGLHPTCSLRVAFSGITSYPPAGPTPAHSSLRSSRRLPVSRYAPAPCSVGAASQVFLRASMSHLCGPCDTAAAGQPRPAR